jgi:hypothetical protein
MTEEEHMTEQETFSAKQIARRIGTDAKTFRKWLRSGASPYTAVGQGQRYEFPVTDLSKIDEQFHAWKDRGPRGKLPPVNGRSTLKARAQKIDREPSEHRGLPMIKSGKKLNPAEFRAEVEAREAARDEVYEVDEEPTVAEIYRASMGIDGDDLMELEDLELDDLDD